MTPTGIETATFLFVAQHLNHCAAAVHPTRDVTNSVSFQNISHRQSVYVTLFHFSHDRPNWPPTLCSTTFQNFAVISDQLSEVSKFQHHIKLCSKWSILIVSSLNLSQIIFYCSFCRGRPKFNFKCSSCITCYSAAQTAETFHILHFFFIYNNLYPRHRPLYPLRKSSRCLLHQRLCGPHSHCGGFGVRTNSCPCRYSSAWQPSSYAIPTFLRCLMQNGEKAHSGAVGRDTAL